MAEAGGGDPYWHLAVHAAAGIAAKLNSAKLLIPPVVHLAFFTNNLI
jgi:hypothetical protein